MERYFIDERVGCIAIRDRELTNPDDNGLHGDTKGVVWYHHGEHTPIYCSECGQVKSHEWKVPDIAIHAAKLKCNRLNKGEKC